MMKQRIGFIGLGTMGQPMADQLLEAGYDLVLYNRTQKRAERFMRRGALRVNSPREVGKTCDISITVVSDDKALTDVVIGQHGLYMGMQRGKIHIDMSTISPPLARKLDRLYQAKEAVFLHSPVLGSKPQAADGSLLIFVGGSATAYRRCGEIFEALGKQTWHFDEVTQATLLKLICNQFIASMMVTLAQGLVMTEKAGLESDTLLDVLKASALYAPMYGSKSGKIKDRNLADANFTVTHMLKDIGLMLEAGRELGVPLPGLAPIRELFVAAGAQGFGQQDYSAVIKVLEQQAGVSISEAQSASQDPA